MHSAQSFLHLTPSLRSRMLVPGPVTVTAVGMLAALTPDSFPTQDRGSPQGRSAPVRGTLRVRTSGKVTAVLCVLSTHTRPPALRVLGSLVFTCFPALQGGAMAIRGASVTVQSPCPPLSNCRSSEVSLCSLIPGSPAASIPPDCGVLLRVSVSATSRRKLSYFRKQ